MQTYALPPASMLNDPRRRPGALPPLEMLPPAGGLPDPNQPADLFNNYGFGAPRVVVNDTGMQIGAHGALPTTPPTAPAASMPPAAFPGARPARNSSAALLASGGLPPPPASGGTIQLTGGPALTVPPGYGEMRPALPAAAFPGGMPPAAPTASMTPPPAMTPEAFASEAARRAVAEGGDPIATRKAAEAIRPPTAAPAVNTIDVGGRRLSVGPGDKYFDEQGNPVDFAGERPMSATDWIISGNRPEDYASYRDKFARATGKPEAATQGEGAMPDLTKPITPQQAAKLPKGTRFIGENGKTYTKN